MLWQQAVCNKCCQCEAATIWRAQGEVWKECWGGNIWPWPPRKQKKASAASVSLRAVRHRWCFNYREKTTHIPLASFTQMWQEEDRRVDPTPCSFRKDGEMKRREGCWLDGWSPSPLLPLSCFMMLVSFCAMLMWSTGEEEWRLSNPPFLPQIWYCWSKTDTLPTLVCVSLCIFEQLVSQRPQFNTPYIWYYIKFVFNWMLL